MQWRIIYSIDFLLLPIFAVVLTSVFIIVRNSRYSNSIIKRYFLPALLFRFIGAFLTGLMYQYYYNGGDTFWYFMGTQDIYFTAFKDFPASLEMIFQDYRDLHPVTKSYLTFHRFFMSDTEAMVVRIGGFLSLFTFGSYFGISLILTSFAFWGCWKLFLVFYDIYPQYHRALAFSILMVPSVCFWGTGLMKDSIVMGALGIFVNAAYTLFIKRQQLLRTLIMLMISGWLIMQIKVYVILALLPAMLIWVLLMQTQHIKSVFFRRFAAPIFFLAGTLGGLVAVQVLGQFFPKYSLENLLLEAEKIRWWLEVSTARDGGTSYDLGEFDPSLFGIMRAFPVSVNVALFRPYIWEVRKPIVLISSLESTVCLVFFLYIFFKTGISKTLQLMFNDPVIMFCLVFAIMFAFSVGFTSTNFGALARYKIPCLPFFYSALFLLYYKSKNMLSLTEQLARATT
ncbi:MAG: hypothetical protein MK212_22285 [Saprospiraceae bacterium]|nr:hypothetical protein [Saprospiraceae bacterium]